MEKLVHRTHDVRMRIEGTPRQADIGWTILAEPLHPFVAPTHHANRKATPESLAVGDEIGLNAEIFLRAAERQPEADEHFVEDQRDPAFAAHRPELLQPTRIGLAIEMRRPAAVDQ